MPKTLTLFPHKKVTLIEVVLISAAEPGLKQVGLPPVEGPYLVHQ